jgi:hypothetical protein
MLDSRSKREDCNNYSFSRMTYILKRKNMIFTYKIKALSNALWWLGKLFFADLERYSIL